MKEQKALNDREKVGRKSFLSFITVVLNAAKDLEGTIQSIISQTYNKLITDGTLSQKGREL